MVPRSYVDGAELGRVLTDRRRADRHARLVVDDHRPAGDGRPKRDGSM